MLLAASMGCSSEKKTRSLVPAASASGTLRRKPLDKLAKGELAASNTRVFGFAMPKRMKLTHQSPKAAHMLGQVTPEDLSNYVRQRVNVPHVEVGAARTVFPTATIKGGNLEKRYRLEVVLKSGGKTELVIRDITKPPKVEGLTEEERWKRAGRNPDGTPIDLRKLE